MQIMEHYESQIMKESNLKQTLDSIENMRNERTPECTPKISVNCSNCCNDRIFCTDEALPKKNSFVMSNELYISLNSDSSQPSMMCSINDRLDIFSAGCHSTPASPEETERTRSRQIRKDMSLFHSPTIEKKLPFSFSTALVRTSKSEDQLLRKSSLTTVNIDIEDELASSLDTLLDTQADDDDVFDRDMVREIRAQSPDDSSSRRDCSFSSSETTSLSQSSVKKQHPLKQAEKQPIINSEQSQINHAEPLSESSGSEIIPSESSSTIRKDSDVDCECTSEQISAISSLDDGTDISRATDSDLGTPEGSLSPEMEMNLDEAWNDQIAKEPVSQHDLSHSSKLLNHKAHPSSQNIELNLTIPTSKPTDNNRLQLQLQLEKSPPSCSSSFSTVPKVDVSLDSPTSPCSEDTLNDLSYQELTESYDELSALPEPEKKPDKIDHKVPSEDVLPQMQRCESPPTDDESDIESLRSFHYNPKAVDMPSALRLAKRLYNLEGFKKTDVSRHLSKNNEFNRAVADEYVKFFEFTGDGLDVALRKFLNQFCLVGETQERERVLVHFSKRYLDCNPQTFRSQDAVHTLTCALMLLNTDLHGENLRRKMVCGEFIENLSDLNDGENYPRDVLKSLYHSIKSHPLEWATDEAVDKKGNAKDKKSSEYRQNFVCHNPFLEVPNPNCATEYKKGYVMRKCCMDPSGKKTALGRRSWKMLYATLRDLVLYLHKDEHGFKKNQLYESLHNSVRIHHTYAEKAIDYTKKQYVFRLYSADAAVYLFQTSDSKELDSWVDTINLVAASLSAPPLPSGVGYQRKFQRPLLPVSHTKLNLREQLQDHETRIMRLEKELEELMIKTPEKSLKSRFIHEFTEKETHLQNELTRYRTYAFLLRTRMAQYPELETPLVQTSIGELDEPVEKSNSPSPTNSPINSPNRKSQNSPIDIRDRNT